MDGASLRTVKLFEALYDEFDIDVITYKNKSLNNEVFHYFRKTNFYFFSSNFESPKPVSFLNRLIASTLPGFSSHNPKSIANDINRILDKNGHYSILYFATQLMGQAKLHLNSEIYSILDLYDIYSTYTKTKMKGVHFFRPYYWLFAIEAIRVRRFEKNIIKNFNILLTTCNENKYAVKDLCPESSILKIANGTMLPKNIKIRKGNSLLMVGNFEYSGNFEGIKWFLENVWPSLKKKTDLMLLLVGKYSNSLKKLVVNDSQIQLTGMVPKLDSYYENAGCVILPLFNDGGTKTKLIEAMAYGIPIVSTHVGAKGFESINTIYKTDNPKKFSKYILKIFANDIKYDSLIATQKFVAKNLSWKEIGRKLKYSLKNLPIN